MKKIVVAIVAVLALVGAGSVIALAAQHPDRSSHSVAAVQSRAGQHEQGTANSPQMCDNEDNNDEDTQEPDEQGQDEMNQSGTSLSEQGCQEEETTGSTEASDYDR